MAFTERSQAFSLLLLCVLGAGSGQERRASAQQAPAQTAPQRDLARDLESWARALTCTDSGCASVGMCSLPREIPLGLLEGISLQGVDRNRIRTMPLYHDECAYDVEDLRSERTTRADSPKNGKQIIKTLLHRGWFKQASLVIVACFESCKSSARCAEELSRPDPRGFNQLSVWRCNKVYDHLVSMQQDPAENEELAKKIVRVQIHCRDKNCAGTSVSNPSKEAMWRRISLIFLNNNKGQEAK